jgi:hypothetical protein
MFLIAEILQEYHTNDTRYLKKHESCSETLVSEQLPIKKYFYRVKAYFSSKKSRTCEITNLEPKVHIIEQVHGIILP